MRLKPGVIVLFGEMLFLLLGKVSKWGHERWEMVDLETGETYTVASESLRNSSLYKELT